MQCRGLSLDGRRLQLALRPFRALLITDAEGGMARAATMGNKTKARKDQGIQNSGGPGGAQGGLKKDSA